MDDAYGVPLAAAVAERFAAVGGEVVASIAYPDDAPSYDDEVARLAAATPDCAVYIGFESSAGTLFNNWYDLPGKPDLQWIGTDGIKTDLDGQKKPGPNRVNQIKILCNEILTRVC